MSNGMFAIPIIAFIAIIIILWIRHKKEWKIYLTLTVLSMCALIVMYGGGIFK